MHQHGHGHRHGHDHLHDTHSHSSDGFDQHGNPLEIEHYIAKLEDPERAAWQLPDRVVEALELTPGNTVGEIGAGTGYFTRRMARLVGPNGRVFAVDVDPRILTVLRDRLKVDGIGNVTPVLGLQEDPLLPDWSCDRVLVVNALHHFTDPTATLKRLARLLKPGGLIANIDFDKRETAMGPPLEHRISREDCLERANAAGLELAAEPNFLEHQYFLLLRAR